MVEDREGVEEVVGVLEGVNPRGKERVGEGETVEVPSSLKLVRADELKISCLNPA